MRLALLAHTHLPIREPFGGGLEMHTHVLAKELAARGHEVTLYAQEGSRIDGQPVRIVETLPAGFSWTDTTSRRDPSREAAVDAAMRRAIAGVRNDPPDVVINSSLNPLPYTELADFPVLTLLHTPPTIARINDVLADKSFEIPVLHRHLSVSHINALQWRFLVPDVAVVHNGVDLAEWGPVDAPIGTHAIFSGRITSEKGVDVAIDAAQAAGMALRIAGPISDRRYWDQFIAPRLNDRITWIGHLDHRTLRIELASAAVAVSAPLWPEPFGLSTLEAMACGTPIAALPTGAMQEIVGPRSGVLAEHVTADALATAMLQAAQLPREPVRAAAERFGIGAMLDGYERVLEELVATVKSAPAYSVSASLTREPISSMETAAACATLSGSSGVGSVRPKTRSGAAALPTRSRVESSD